MDYSDIDLKTLKRAVNAILDHLIEDLHVEKVAIEEKEDFYWDCPAPEIYDSSKQPVQLDAGRLSDDVGFIEAVDRGQSRDVSYNLVHIASILRYVGEKVKR
jgi:hypothetical protein